MPELRLVEVFDYSYAGIRTEADWARGREMRWAAVSLAIFLASAMGGQVAAQKRVALVIGNDSYVRQTRLSNSGRDAQIIAAQLKKLGFKLVGGGPLVDVDKMTADKAVEAFGAEARDAEVALFYFSGLAMQVGGANYLLPVDLASETSVEYRALNADLVVKIMSMSGARLGLILLDAKAPNGLAQIQAPKGVIISFAAEPNTTAMQGPPGGNSPYAEAIATYMRVEGLGLSAMLNEIGLAVMAQTDNRQRPWLSMGPIERTVCLNAPCYPEIGALASSPRILATGLSLLPASGKEEAGYGLYSYAVLTSNSDRSSAFLKEIFSSVPSIGDAGAEPQHLNVLYLPTKKETGDRFAEKARSRGYGDPTRLMGPTPTESGRLFSKSLYDYKMARQILNNICNPPAEAVRGLCEGDMSRGPYIFTYSRPGSTLKPVHPPFLFVDLSDVDPRAFGEFIAAFRAQVKREDISDGAKINTLRLQVLKITLKAGDFVVPVRKSIADIIHSSGTEKAVGK